MNEWKHIAAGIILSAVISIGGAAITTSYLFGKTEAQVRARLLALEVKIAEHGARLDKADTDRRELRDWLIEFRAEQRQANISTLDAIR
ncbi:MAG: hypothetical protein ACOC4K_02905, partial [Verrucomicrobiota bacterium]